MSHHAVRRSGLTMPVNNPRFVQKAWTRGCDFIILDLEDSVPPAEKGPRPYPRPGGHRRRRQGWGRGVRPHQPRHGHGGFGSFRVARG